MTSKEGMAMVARWEGVGELDGQGEGMRKDKRVREQSQECDKDRVWCGWGRR